MKLSRSADRAVRSIRRFPPVDRRALRAAVSIAAASAGSLLPAQRAAAFTYAWKSSPANGGWSGAGAWTPVGPPANGSDVMISVIYPITVTYDYAGTNTFKSLHLDNTLSQSANTLSSGTEYVGYTGSGVITQSGGGNFVTGGGTNGLYLGYSGGSVGTYNLSSSGTLSVVSTEDIGWSGTGVFNQTGGANTTATLLLGNTGAGTYNLGDPGTLSVSSYEAVGVSGTGVFNQTGGTNTIINGGSLYLGSNAGATGTYNLSGGTFTTPGIYVGGNAGGTGGAGVLNISGGLLNAGASGITVYNTSSGTTSSVMILSGGTVTVGSLVLPDWSRLNFTGGTLNLGTGVNSNAGALTVGDSGGTATLNQTTLNSAASAGSLTLGNNAGSTGTYNLANSASFSTGGGETVGNSGTGVFNHTGGTNSTGGDLTLGNASGSTGTYNLSNSASLTVGGTVYVGKSGTGVFNQAGGTHAAGGLWLGRNSGSSGTYNLSNGASLTVNGSDIVGFDGTGVFNQTGGTHNANGGLSLGYDYASGTYNLSNSATLNAANELVGFTTGSTGTFNQSGGINTTGELDMIAGGSSYNLSNNGVLVVSGRETFAQGGSTTFNQTGGTNTCGTLTVSNAADSTYNLSNGVLNVSGGETLAGYRTTVFNQTGGTANITGGGLSTDFGAYGETGIYNLSNSGVLTVGGGEIIGKAANGFFNQTGGSNTITSGSLSLGNNAGGIGTYNLSNSATLSVNGAEYVGYSGSGVFTQTGGSNTVSGDSLYLGFSGGSTGAYNLSGGTFTTPNIYVGGGATSGGGVGTLNVTGGLLTATNITIWNASSGVTLNGGTVTAASVTTPDWALLNFVSGTLNLTTGTSSNAGTLALGPTATLNLQGGVLSATNTVNNGLLAQTGGNASLGTVSGTGGVSLSGSNALAAAGKLTQNLLAIQGNATFNLTPDPAFHQTAPFPTSRATSTLGGLSIPVTFGGAGHPVAATGLLDIGTSNLYVGTPTAASVTAVKQLVAAGYNASGYGNEDGDWNGRGITSTLARQGYNPAVGVSKFSVAYAYGGDQSVQDQQGDGAGIGNHNLDNVGPNQTLVKAVLTGDVNMDGLVDFNDIISILAYHYNDGQPAHYTDGDVANHGVVNFDDIQFVLAANYNSGQKAPDASASKATAAKATAAKTLTGSASPATATASSASATASSAQAAPAATLSGTLGDGKSDFVYDPNTGDLKFVVDGQNLFASSSTTASFVSTLQVNSLTGVLLFNNASSGIKGGVSPTLTANQVSAAQGSAPGFTDGVSTTTFDLGNILPAGEGTAFLLGDLTVKFQIANNGLAKASDLVVPEPAGLSLAALAGLGLLGRRRRKAAKA